MQIQPNMKTVLGVFLTTLLFLAATPGMAREKEKVGEFVFGCPHSMIIELHNTPEGKLTMTIMVLAGPWSWEHDPNGTFRGSARYCPEHGECVDANADVKFTQFTNKRMAGTFSTSLPNGGFKRGLFRARWARKLQGVCE